MMLICDFNIKFMFSFITVWSSVFTTHHILMYGFININKHLFPNKYGSLSI